MRSMVIGMCLLCLVGCGQKKVEKQTPEEITVELFRAVYDNDFDRLKEYHEKGGDIQVRDEKGRTTLMLAAARGNLAMVQYLERNGVNPDIQTNTGWTAFCYACKSNNPDTAQWLNMEKSRQHRTKSGDSPLDIARKAEKYYADIIEAWKQYGDDAEEVADHLNETGHRRPGGKLWDESAVKAYKDYNVYGHTAIVRMLEIDNEAAQWKASKGDKEKEPNKSDDD
jgi:hypothetical protein